MNDLNIALHAHVNVTVFLPTLPTAAPSTPSCSSAGLHCDRATPTDARRSPLVLLQKQDGGLMPFPLGVSEWSVARLVGWAEGVRATLDECDGRGQLAEGR